MESNCDVNLIARSISRISEINHCDILEVLTEIPKIDISLKSRIGKQVLDCLIYLVSFVSENYYKLDNGISNESTDD